MAEFKSRSGLVPILQNNTTLLKPPFTSALLFVIHALTAAGNVMAAVDSTSTNGRWSDSISLSAASGLCGGSASSLPLGLSLARVWPQLLVCGREQCASLPHSYSTGSKRGRCCLLIWRHLSVPAEPLTSRASCFGDPIQPYVYKQPHGRWSPAGWWGLPSEDYTCTCNNNFLPSKTLHTNPCPLALLFVLLCTDLKWIPSQVSAAGQTAIGTCGDNGCTHL